MKDFEHSIVKSLINTMFPYSILYNATNDNTAPERVYKLNEHVILAYNDNKVLLRDHFTHKDRVYIYQNMQDMLNFVVNNVEEFGLTLFFIY